MTNALKEMSRDRVVQLGLLGILLSVAVSFIELDEVMGLPAHILLVHFPVVLIPLATTMTLAIMLRDQWRKTLGFAVMAITLAGAGAAVMAAGAGEQLRDRGFDDDIAAHASAGETLRIIAFVFGIVMVAFIAIDRHGRRRREEAPGTSTSPVEIGARVLVVATAIVAASWTAYTGHLGSEAVWSERNEETNEAAEEAREAAEDARKETEEAAEDAREDRSGRGGKGK